MAYPNHGCIIFLINKFMISKVSQTIYVYKTTLIRIIDGDTIEADIDLGFKLRWTTPIRFWGFDAYETRGATAHPLGNAGKAFLAHLFEKFGNVFYIHTNKDAVAIYNRVEAKLYLETITADGKKAFVDVIATMKLNGFDKSGTTPFVEGREPLYKMIVAADIDTVIKPVA